MTYYYTLMTSLPHHDRHFKVKQTPLSYLQLEKRLKLLTEAEQVRLHNIIFLLWDSWFLLTLPLSEITQRAKPLLALNDLFITDIINWFFDIRSLFVALRLRQIQKNPPHYPQEYWQTSWNRSLIKHWNQADFNLGRTYPWLLNVNDKLAKDEINEVENILLTIIWKHLEVIEVGHYFDFAALILYLLRWKMIDYWSRFNEESALERMINITDDIARDH